METNVVENHDEYGHAFVYGENGKAIAHGKCGRAYAWDKYGFAEAHSEYGTATAGGEFGKAIAHGEKGNASAYNESGQVKGSQLGCKLVIYNRATDVFFREIVGENEIKADTWYGLKDDKFIEMKDE